MCGLVSWGRAPAPAMAWLLLTMRDGHTVSAVDLRVGCIARRNREEKGSRREFMVATCLITLAAVTFGQTSHLTYADTFTTDLLSPGRLAPAPGGGVYVTDQLNAQVVHYDASGGVVGLPQAIPEGPVGIAVHPNGNIFVLDTGNDRFQEFDSTGSFLSLTGAEGPNPVVFRFPLGLACDPGGNVFVIDTGHHLIQRFSP